MNATRSNLMHSVGTFCHQPETILKTFADNAAIIESSTSPDTAVSDLQSHAQSMAKMV